MEAKPTSANQGVNTLLYNWANSSKLIKKAFRVSDSDWPDSSLSSFFLDVEEKRELAAIELYKKLWGAYSSFGPLPPIDLLRKFEHDRVFYSDYRDHTTHSLNTCFLGLYIYENNITVREAVSSFIRKDSLDSTICSTEEAFLFIWLLTSLYHDIGYLVENKKIDEDNSDEFKSIKKEIDRLLRTPLAATPFFSRKNITEEQEGEYNNTYEVFVPSIRSIDNIEQKKYFSMLQRASYNTNLAVADVNGIERYYNFAKSHTPKYRDSPYRDHGISSALLLLHIWHSYRSYLSTICSKGALNAWYPEGYNDICQLNETLPSFSRLVSVAAQAISLHNINKSVWKETDSVGNQINLHGFCIKLHDDDSSMPIAFLLRLCDELQVWDRPRFRAPAKNDKTLHANDLNITVSDSGVFVRFFEDDGLFVRPDTYKDGNFKKLKNQLEKYLQPKDIGCILKYDINRAEHPLQEGVVPNSFDEAFPTNIKDNPPTLRRKEARLAKGSNGAYHFEYNSGRFNIYLSKAKAFDVLAPHRHDNMDEVSIITSGRAYVCIGNAIHALSADDAILLPAGQLHEFIPRTYPCEFITMGNEDEISHTYKTNWDQSFAELDDLEQALNETRDEESLDVYKKVVAFLESEIMEVRWRATEILKQYLALEDEQGIDVKSLVTAAVQNKLRSDLIENKIIGISMACSFHSLISANMIHKIMTSRDYFMLPWICTYYILDNAKNYDYEKMFSKVQHSGVYDETSSQDLCVFYDRVLIAILQLIMKSKDNLIRTIISEDIPYQPKTAIPVDEIVLHFVLWDTSRQVQADTIDFSSIEKKLTEIQIANGERILRGLLNFDHENERFGVLNDCRKQGILLDVARVFYTSIRRNGENNMNEVNYIEVKNRIKNYLRILVTDACNLQCVYCHKEGRHTGLNAQSVDQNENFDLRAVLQIAKDTGISKVKISGGEPLLFPNIIEICEEFQDAFSDIGFTTNGLELMNLKKQLSDSQKKKLTFNVTLNCLDDAKYTAITCSNKSPHDVISGIDLLLKLGYKVKINSVITSFNFDDIHELVTFAAIRKIDIKLLDLFSVDGTPGNFQRISIAEIKNKIMELYRLNNDEFFMENDYLCANVLGIKVMLPQRVYSIDCQYNCPMYPCAEGLFGIRVYEDYSCSQCFKAGELHIGALGELKNNIEAIRRTIENTRMVF